MHLATRLALPLLMLVGVRGQAERDPGAVLDRARARLREMTQRLSRYACIETVERTYFASPEPLAGASCSQIQAARRARTRPLKVEGSDRLRLEVTLSERHEIHAWPGATRFDTRDVDQIIRQGRGGTGKSDVRVLVFCDNPGGEFKEGGEKQDNGHGVLK